MSLFEIGNYVIIDDLYIGKIIKKIWNGYGMIIKLDNQPNYLDNTILQYHLLNDVVDNSDISGFMLAKSENKIRLVNKHNLAEIIKNELTKEKFIYIENKLNNNYNFFINNILPNIRTNTLQNVPVVNVPNTMRQTSATQNAIVGGNLDVNEQLKKINNYVDLKKLKEKIPTNEEINFNNLNLETNINSKMSNYINIIGGVYNPYINNINKINPKIEIPKLINTAVIQKGANNKSSLVAVHHLLETTDQREINDGTRQDLLSIGTTDTTGTFITTDNKNKFVNNLNKSQNKSQEEDEGSENEEEKDKIKKYREQDKAEDNYELYIRNTINNLFKSEYEIDHEEFFEDDKLTARVAENLNLLAKGEREEKIKPTIKLVLEKFKKINKSLYLDLTNTLLYKHIIADNKLDNVSFGKELILRIKECLLNLQKKIRFEDNRPTDEIINLFNYLKFKIAGGYILIEDITKENTNVRTITPELVPNLNLLKEQYGNPINYQILSNIILENKSTLDVKKNKEIIVETLNILAQDYFICVQSRVEYLLWTLTRLILCWYADPVLNENIVKIKVLINLYRARGIKDFNKDIGVQPVILIVPKYGRDSALKILSTLSYYFFPYKNVGWKGSSPSYFNKVDDLLYYTNGSIDLKKYIKHLLKTGNEIVSPISNDFTKIKLENNSNDIEYKLPK